MIKYPIHTDFVCYLQDVALNMFSLFVCYLQDVALNLFSLFVCYLQDATLKFGWNKEVNYEYIYHWHVDVL